MTQCLELVFTASVFWSFNGIILFIHTCLNLFLRDLHSEINSFSGEKNGKIIHPPGTPKRKKQPHNIHSCYTVTSTANIVLEGPLIHPSIITLIFCDFSQKPTSPICFLIFFVPFCALNFIVIKFKVWDVSIETLPLFIGFNPKINQILLAREGMKN